MLTEETITHTVIDSPIHIVVDPMDHHEVEEVEEVEESAEKKPSSKKLLEEAIEPEVKVDPPKVEKDSPPALKDPPKVEKDAPKVKKIERPLPGTTASIVTERLMGPVGLNAPVAPHGTFSRKDVQKAKLPLSKDGSPLIPGIKIVD